MGSLSELLLETAAAVNEGRLFPGSGAVADSPEVVSVSIFFPGGRRVVVILIESVAGGRGLYEAVRGRRENQ